MNFSSSLNFWISILRKGGLKFSYFGFTIKERACFSFHSILSSEGEMSLRTMSYKTVVKYVSYYGFTFEIFFPLVSFVYLMHFRILQPRTEGNFEVNLIRIHFFCFFCSIFHETKNENNKVKLECFVLTLKSHVL